MTIQVRLRKWGNSLGIILPKDFADRERLQENKKIIIKIVKEADLSDIFGLVKKRKMPGQKMKDLSREEWKK